MTRTQRSLVSSAAELVLIAAAAVGLALAAQAFIWKPYRIPSTSMEPTLAVGQRILVDRLGAGSQTMHIGDIVAFHPPIDYEQGCADRGEGQNVAGQPGAQPCAVARTRSSSLTFVKRVVGLPGDLIAIRDGRVIRNGLAERAPYIRSCGRGPICNFSGVIRVPRGEYFVLGDNRGESDDSRLWGPIRRAWIIGKAFFSYWPPDRIGSV